MQIRMLYFAAARARAGLSEEGFELPPGATLAQLLEAASARHPSLGELLGWARMAVNQDFAPPERVLAEGDEVAVIPPVSGG